MKNTISTYTWGVKASNRRIINHNKHIKIVRTIKKQCPLLYERFVRPDLFLYKTKIEKLMRKLGGKVEVITFTWQKQ